MLDSYFEPGIRKLIQRNQDVFTGYKITDNVKVIELVSGS